MCRNLSYYCLLAPRKYIFVVRAHPVRGESHNQRNTTGEVAAQTLNDALIGKLDAVELYFLIPIPVSILSKETQPWFFEALHFTKVHYVIVYYVAQLRRLLLSTCAGAYDANDGHQRPADQRLGGDVSGGCKQGCDSPNFSIRARQQRKWRLRKHQHIHQPHSSQFHAENRHSFWKLVEFARFHVYFHPLVKLF